MDPSTPSDRSGFVHRITAFALVAGLGLSGDVLTYAALVSLGASPGWSNAAAALVGITMTYALSVRRIFSDARGARPASFAWWLTWQCVLVTCASSLVEWLATSRGCGPVLAKAVVTPATFLANFAAMTLITRKGRPDISASRA